MFCLKYMHSFKPNHLIFHAGEPKPSPADFGREAVDCIVTSQTQSTYTMTTNPTCIHINGELRVFCKLNAMWEKPEYKCKEEVVGVLKI